MCSSFRPEVHNSHATAQDDKLWVTRRTIDNIVAILSTLERRKPASVHSRFVEFFFVFRWTRIRLSLLFVEITYFDHQEVPGDALNGLYPLTLGHAPQDRPPEAPPVRRASSSARNLHLILLRSGSGGKVEPGQQQLVVLYFLLHFASPLPLRRTSPRSRRDHTSFLPRYVPHPRTAPILGDNLQPNELCFAIHVPRLPTVEIRYMR